MSVRQGYGRCQNSPGVYNALKKILVASRPAGSPPKTPSSLRVPAHGRTKPACTEAQQTCPPPPSVFIQLCAMRICIFKERSCSWSERGLRRRGERADFCAFQGRWDVLLPHTGDFASGLFADTLCCTRFFGYWYVVASTVCALLMVFKALDMWQPSRFTVNHQKVIT